MNYLGIELEELMKGDARVAQFVHQKDLDGLWYWDLENPENEWISSAFWKTLGYDALVMEKEDMPFKSCVHQDDESILNQYIEQIIESQEDYNEGVLRYRHRQGPTVWLKHQGLIIRNGNGVPIRLLRAFRNITQEIVSSQMLRINHSLLESSFESFENILVFTIDLNYRFQMFNKPFQKATFDVYGTQVVIGGSMLECMTLEADRRKAITFCELAMKGSHPLSVESYGELKREYFETRYQQICDEKGQANGITILSANVSARVEAENMLKEAFYELESFSYSVSHDLRAPMRNSQGYSAVLEEDVDDLVHDKSRNLLGHTSHSANQMSGLIDDVLKFSKSGKRELIKQPTNMSAIVSDVIVEMRDKSERHLFKVELEHLPDVFCDGGLLRQVWYNLIDNAIKYSSQSDHPTVVIKGEVEENKVICQISDNGVGFDMQQYHKLFALFQRLHRQNEFGGNGIGLAFVERILFKHGGRIWATSSPAHHTCFYFSLPLSGE